MENVSVLAQNPALHSPAVLRYLLRHRRIMELLGSTELHQEQRTDSWHAKRASIPINGSSVGAIIRSAAGRRQVMKTKLEPRERSDDLRETPEACRHGILLEDVVKDIWSKQNGVRIIECGSMTHPNHPELLSASPDGIVDTRGVSLDAITEQHGRLIEIKCPLSREIKAGKVPADYWHQMQLQMECVGLDECSFLEFQVTMGQIANMQEFLAADYGLAKGYITLTGDMRSRTGWKIFYPGEPVDEALLAGLAGSPDCSLMYWVLHKVQEQLVKHDPEWLPKHMPLFLEFAQELDAHRKAGTVPETPPAKYDGTTYLDLTSMQLETPAFKSNKLELPDNPFT